MDEFDAAISGAAWAVPGGMWQAMAERIRGKAGAADGGESQVAAVSNDQVKEAIQMAFVFAQDSDGNPDLDAFERAVEAMARSIARLRQPQQMGLRMKLFEEMSSLAKTAEGAGDMPQFAVLLGHLREIARDLDSSAPGMSGGATPGLTLVVSGDLPPDVLALGPLCCDLTEALSGHSYEIAAICEHLANETRVGILRALLAAEGPVGLKELADRAMAGPPEECERHLGPLLDAGLVEWADDGYALPVAARRWSVLALALGRAWLRECPEEVV